jgi:hypothetical protein
LFALLGIEQLDVVLVLAFVNEREFAACSVVFGCARCGAACASTESPSIASGGFTIRTSMSQLKSIAELHDRNPGFIIRDGGKPRGWCDATIVSYFRKHLKGCDGWVINGGTYFGLSAWEMARIAPEAKIICLDHFKGSVEHQGRPGVDRMYEVFVSNLWEYRDRMFPLVADSVEGMELIADAGIVPGLIFIDMSHDIESVYDDTVAAAQLWPKSIVCGDDYNWDSVAIGVAKAAALLSRPIRSRQPWWVLG